MDEKIEFAETIIPNRAANPQEAYLSSLALPFAALTEAKLIDKQQQGE